MNVEADDGTWGMDDEVLSIFNTLKVGPRRKTGATNNDAGLNHFANILVH